MIVVRPGGPPGAGSGAGSFTGEEPAISTAMPAPTNPRKRALMPSSPLRKALRAAGHHLSPVVQVGKEGVTPAVVEQLHGALAAHELVKVKIGTESPEDRFEAAERLGQDAEAQIAQILGRTILAYRRHPEKPRFEPLTPAERQAKGVREPAREAPARRGARRPEKRRPSSRRPSARGSPRR